VLAVAQKRECPDGDLDALEALEATDEKEKAAVTVAAAILGLSLDTWIKIVTLCALLLSGGYTAWKWHREWRRAKLQDAENP